MSALSAWYDANVQLLFDGEPVGARVSLPELGDAASGRRRQLVIVRLEGTIPYDAAHFSWRSDEELGTVVLNARQEGHEEVVLERVDPGGTSGPFPLRVSPPRPSALSVGLTYVGLGFSHILPKGVDHILFVLGLFLASAAMRPLLIQVTAFTVAHSLTLALSMMQIATLPARIVEPLIAASIVWVAVENLASDRPHRWRPALVFAFGLLHGLGFAGVLTELGLPSGRFATALVGFNVGVELGQLAVIGLALALLGRLHNHPERRRRLVVPASALIGAAGLWWTIERIATG